PLAAAAGGGEAVQYSATTTVLPVQADLRSALAYLDRPIDGTLAAGTVDRYTFSVRPSEVAAPAGGAYLLGVVVEATDGALVPALPRVDGLMPIASAVRGNQAFALFRIENAGLKLLEIAGASAGSSGAYRLSLFAAGDANRDGSVDVVDAALL